MTTLLTQSVLFESEAGGRAAATAPGRLSNAAPGPTGLYTAEQRRRRDASAWTTVQAILAPIQFAVFLVSVGLIIRFALTGNGLALATASVVVKTIALYAIMITGSLWEREVFGRYLFAAPFYWEDVVSMLVLALHTGYLAALLAGAPAGVVLTIAVVAYASYVVNAAQFVLKLRAARLSRPDPRRSAGAAP